MSALNPQSKEQYYSIITEIVGRFPRPKRMRGSMKIDLIRAWLSKLGYIKTMAVVTIVLYTVGTAAHLYQPTLGLMTAMTPWFLLVCGLAVIWPSIRLGGKRFVIWGASVYVVTFALEALGVSTGFVFGEYRYGPTLGLAALGVPLVIAFNWTIVVYGAVCMAGRRKRSNLMTAAIAGAVATMFDWIMEPVAIRLNYWTWAGADIPFQNYLSWFVIATVTAYAYRSVGQEYGKNADGAGTLAGLYVLVQAGFFAALRLGWHLGI